MSLLKHHDLLKSLIKREVRTKYRNATLGMSWMIINPLLLLGTYTLVFGFIYGNKWRNLDTTGDFVLMLFCGLIIYMIFSETMSRSCITIRSQPNLIKKVVFPLEILPLVVVGTCVFTACINLLILVFLTFLIKFNLPATILFAPIVILPFILLMAGFAWIVAGSAVFLPDLDNVVIFLNTLMLFLSPIFYPVSAAPEILQPFFMFNPLAFPIEELRKVLLLGESPYWTGLAIYCVVASILAYLGFWIFQQGREIFSDVV